jgi:hypothetical protein
MRTAEGIRQDDTDLGRANRRSEASSEETDAKNEDISE